MTTFNVARRAAACQYQCLALFESRPDRVEACRQGCAECRASITNEDATARTCALTCKTIAWNATNPREEPTLDQMCLTGCVLSLCQSVCIGATCALKSGYGRSFVQGGSSNCCMAAYALCLDGPASTNAPDELARLASARDMCQGRSVGNSTVAVELTPTSSKQDVCLAYAIVQAKRPPECSNAGPGVF